MLKKYFPIGLVSLVIFTGCEFFSTREILPKPSNIHSFQGFSKPGDSLLFQVTESIQEPGNAMVLQQLSKRKLSFTFLGDSIVADKSWKLVALKVTEAPSGIVLERSRRLLDYSGNGLVMMNPETSGGVRFFPLKVGTESSSTDSNAFLALPMVFFQGWSLNQKMGLLEIKRNLAVSTDTLPFQSHSEATWLVDETVSDRGSKLLSGQYWYGASGLLKVEQTWSDFGWREANASTLAASIPGQTVNLYRSLVRL